jgi:ESF2/ABP1 family protein
MVKKSSLQAINDDSRFDTLGWGDDEIAEEVQLNDNEDSEDNLENEEGDEEAEEENDEVDEEEVEGENESDNNSDKEITEADSSEEKSVAPKKLKKNQIKDLEAFNQKVAKSGVVYLSRIPPRLKPSKLRTLLEDRGAKIGRIYLAPEDLHSKNRRKATGGGNDRRFTEGWVEFEDKKKAKAYASFLNTTPMSNFIQFCS